MKDGNQDYHVILGPAQSDDPLFNESVPKPVMMVNVDDGTTEPLYVSLGEGISSSSDTLSWQAGLLDNGSEVRSKLIGGAVHLGGGKFIAAGPGQKTGPDSIRETFFFHSSDGHQWKRGSLLCDDSTGVASGLWQRDMGWCWTSPSSSSSTSVFIQKRRIELGLQSIIRLS